MDGAVITEMAAPFFMPSARSFPRKIDTRSLPLLFCPSQRHDGWYNDLRDAILMGIW